MSVPVLPLLSLDDLRALPLPSTTAPPETVDYALTATAAVIREAALRLTWTPVSAGVYKSRAEDWTVKDIMEVGLNGEGGEHARFTFVQCSDGAWMTTLAVTGEGSTIAGQIMEAYLVGPDRADQVRPYFVSPHILRRREAHARASDL